MIISQPVDVVDTEGGNVMFSIMATGLLLQYEWRMNNAVISNGPSNSGANTTTLTLFSVVDSDEGIYTVYVSNPTGNITSDGASLLVGKLFLMMCYVTVNLHTYV